MYKLIASDVDGTLINSRKEVTNRLKELIGELNEKGIIFVICTGRSMESMKVIADKFEFDMPKVAFHGGLVIVDNKIIYKKGMNKREARVIYKEGVKRDFGVVMWSLENRLYIGGNKKFTDEYCKNASARVIPLSIEDMLNDNYKEEIGKILFWGHVPEITRALEEADIYTKGLGVNSHTSFAHLLEFVSADANKGKAIKMVADYYSVKREEIVAFGDGLNDMSLLEYSNLGIAVENANEKLKEIADFVTKSNDEDGVYLALKNIFYGGEKE